VDGVKRAVLIVNPSATRVGDEAVAAVERELRRVADVSTRFTRRPGEATELVAAVARDVEAIFVHAGDGTFNEVLNGVRDDTPLGFVPGGGSSVLPRALGLPRDAVEAARRLAEAFARGRTRRISVGRVNGRRFGFSAGVGLDAEVVRRVDSVGRGEDGRRPGDLVFALTVLRLLAERRGRFEPALEVKGLGRAAFALVANGDPYTYAGPIPLHIAPEARFEDGLDLVAPAAVTAASLPRLFAYAVLGHGHADADDLLYGHDLDRIEIVCDRPLPLQADGEDLGDVAEAVFEAERGAVRVLAPT
jgi:diacylglycerol kinase family enzyme